MKIVEIDSVKKAEDPCPFCNAIPACPGWTCSRLAAVTVDSDGSWTVEFVQEQKPEPDDEPAPAA